MVSRINAANVEGITVTSYRKLPDSAKNAMSLVAAADYTMWFKDGYEPEDEDGFWTGFVPFPRKSLPFPSSKKGQKKGD